MSQSIPIPHYIPIIYLNSKEYNLVEIIITIFNFRQFMVLDLLEEVPITIIDTLINLSKKNAWCKQILKRSDLFTTQ